MGLVYKCIIIILYRLYYLLFIHAVNSYVCSYKYKKVTNSSVGTYLI